MSSQANEHPSSLPSDDLYKQVEDYPWDHDVEFQGGLEAILGSTASLEQAQELTLRARCFYYTRWLVVSDCLNSNVSAYL